MYVRLTVKVQIKLTEMKQVSSNSISFYRSCVKFCEKKNKFFKQNFYGRYVSWIERTCLFLAKIGSSNRKRGVNRILILHSRTCNAEEKISVPFLNYSLVVQQT